VVEYCLNFFLAGLFSPLSGYAASLKTAMEGGTPQTRYRLAAGHSGASVCKACPIEPPSPAAKGNAPVKARDETPASYEGGLMFLAAGPEKVTAKAKKLNKRLLFLAGGCIV